MLRLNVVGRVATTLTRVPTCCQPVRHGSRTIDIIFVQDIPNMAQRGQEKTVKMAHARNILFPRGLAVIATPEAREDFGSYAAKIEVAAAEEKKKQQARTRRKLSKIEKFQIMGINKKGDKILATPITPQLIADKLLMYKGVSHISVEPTAIQLEEPITAFRTPSDVTITVSGRQYTLTVEILN